MSAERRRHVRVAPLPDLPASVEVENVGNGVKFQLLDISVGGLGLWTQRGKAPFGPGDRIVLKLRLGPKSADVDAVVRHTSPDGTLHGVEFADVADEARTIIHRYVSELTERGARV